MQNSGLGKRLLVPRPAGPGAGYLHGCPSDLEARGPGPSPWTSQPWARDPKRHNRVVTGLHGLQRGPPAASWEPLGGGSLCQKVGEGVRQLGDGEGSPCFTPGARGQDWGQEACRNSEGEGTQFAATKEKGARHCVPGKGSQCPLLCPPPTQPQPFPPGCPGVLQATRGPRSGQAGQARPGVISWLHQWGIDPRRLGSELPCGFSPVAPLGSWSRLRGSKWLSQPHTYCVQGWGPSGRRGSAQGGHRARVERGRGQDALTRWAPHLSGRAGAHGPHSAMAPSPRLCIRCPEPSPRPAS